MHLQENTLLQGGKYRIVRYISHGGFGCTYEAVNTTMRNRRVAIKELFVSDFCNRDPRTGSVTVLTQSKQPLFDKLRTKFLDEAEAIMDLNHSGIVRVTDFFEENSTAYYVMDYIDGQSLRDKVEASGELSEADALRYIRQVADAIQYIHTNNRLHLDIKPANIMIDGKDKAILIDFGVSKQYDEASGENTSTLMGYTKGYAPVEQINNSISKFLPATDIYALGATLYHLLSGTIPPPSGELAAGEELPPLPANVSNNTRRAIQAAMTINKLTRPQSVAEFLALLDGKEDSGETLFDDGETDYEEPKKPTPKQKSKPRSDKPFPWPLVALAGIILSVAAVVGLRGCESHSGREAGIPDTTAVATDSATPQVRETGAKPTTEKLIQDALEKQNEKEDRLARLEAENQQMKEKIRQDSLAAVKKAEEAKKAQSTPVVHKSSQWDNLIPLVYVSGGTFTMGATTEQSGEADRDESPTHRVTVSSFYMGQTEVTQAQWKAVMGTTIRQQRDKADTSYSLRGEGDNYPMYYVSHDEAQAFCRELSRLTGKTYRLPTEAEWEYAAWGGNKSQGCKYSGSHSIDRVAWYDGNSGGKTHAVATKQANELGLYDMSGNVWEWCSDWKGSYSSSSQTNPKGASSGQSHVGRGGSWLNNARNCRVSNRNSFPPSDRYGNLGFRVVCVP